MAETVVKTYRGTDAKAFFASERTFLHWISVSVTFGGIAAGLVGVAAQGRQRWDATNESTAIIIHLVGLIILATAIALSVAACFNFYTRGERLRKMSDGPYDSPILVWVVGGVMLLVLAGTWISSIARLA